MRKLNIFFILLLSALLCLSGIMIYKEVSSRQKEKEDFNNLIEIVEQPTKPTENTNTETEITETLNNKSARNLAPLFERNSEFIGWLYIKGTNINYPVMHTPSNPQKYLRKNFDGEYSVSGVPFLDARCDSEHGTAIIYGHNMKNGTQFSDLKKFLNTDFLNANSVIEFETKNGVRLFTVISVKKTDIYDEIYKTIKLEDDTLVLSTCHGSNKNGRLIIIAKEAEANG